MRTVGWRAASALSQRLAKCGLASQYTNTLKNVKVNVVEPGFTATDQNGNRGHQTVAEGAEIIVRMASIGGDGPTGTFQDRNGTVAW